MRGRHRAWQDSFELVKRPFPDLQIRVDDLDAADDKVAIRLVLRGTHQSECQGIPATGRTISYVSHEFYRVANGLFAEEWIWLRHGMSAAAPGFGQLRRQEPAGRARRQL